MRWEKGVPSEELIELIRSLAPSPFREEIEPDGSRTLVCGDPGEVIILFDNTRITISLFEVQWKGPYTPVVTPREMGTVNWVPELRQDILLTLSHLIHSTCNQRRAGFRSCTICGESLPPEWMFNHEMCQSCASSQLGIVY